MEMAWKQRKIFKKREKISPLKLKNSGCDKKNRKIISSFMHPDPHISPLSKTSWIQISKASILSILLWIFGSITQKIRFHIKWLVFVILFLYLSYLYDLLCEDPPDDGADWGELGKEQAQQLLRHLVHRHRQSRLYNNNNNFTKSRLSSSSDTLSTGMDSAVCTTTTITRAGSAAPQTPCPLAWTEPSEQ